MIPTLMLFNLVVSGEPEDIFQKKWLVVLMTWRRGFQVE